MENKVRAVLHYFLYINFKLILCDLIYQTELLIVVLILKIVVKDLEIWHHIDKRMYNIILSS